MPDDSNASGGAVRLGYVGSDPRKGYVPPEAARPGGFQPPAPAGPAAFRPPGPRPAAPPSPIALERMSQQDLAVLSALLNGVVAALDEHDATAADRGATLTNMNVPMEQRTAMMEHFNLVNAAQKEGVVTILREFVRQARAK